MSSQPSYIDTFLLEGDTKEDAGDFDGARHAFEAGAALGDPACWSRLGLMFDNGVGCEVDKERAMSCYRRAWRSHDLCAANNIAILYREAGNRRAMFQWFQRAVGVGDGDALVEVAKCYLEGIGVRRNVAAAIRALTEATASRCITPAGIGEAESILADLQCPWESG
jgi:TPR repeat protein